MTIVYSDALFL